MLLSTHFSSMISLSRYDSFFHSHFRKSKFQSNIMRTKKNFDNFSVWHYRQMFSYLTFYFWRNTKNRNHISSNFCETARKEKEEKKRKRKGINKIFRQWKIIFQRFESDLLWNETFGDQNIFFFLNYRFWWLDLFALYRQFGRTNKCDSIVCSRTQNGNCVNWAICNRDIEKSIKSKRFRHSMRRE